MADDRIVRRLAAILAPPDVVGYRRLFAPLAASFGEALRAAGLPE
jgi:hypothetical protein